MDIGMIGVGNMGFGMANNMIKGGHQLVINDMRRDAAAPLLEDGALWADTAQEVAARTEITFTSLPGPPDVEKVVMGENGVLAGLEPGKVYVDLSSNAPSLVRKLHAILKEKGIDMLDAPVSGGVHGARSGLLAIMVGGEEAVFQRVKPVFDSFGDNVVYCGDIGAGSVCKLVHNTISAITSQAIGELFTLGAKAGKKAAFGRELLYPVVVGVRHV